jgi:copper oxidase (laccase) domain-containing protein
MNMKSPPHHLLAWIGPGISQACFEVGAEVRAAFGESLQNADDFFNANRAGHWLCDLGGLAEAVLTSLGVSEIGRDPHCSFRDAELFYSYRRQAKTGRMASLIWIN